MKQFKTRVYKTIACIICIGQACSFYAVSDWLQQQMIHKKSLPSVFSYQGTYTPDMLAFLDMIAYSEHTVQLGNDGYFAQFPKQNFTGDLSQHPKQVNCITFQGKPLCSSAAGRYQFLSKTWDRCVTALSLPDFTPPSQDLAALFLLDECSALPLLGTKNYSLQTAITIANPVWASLPGSPYGQPVRSLTELEKIFHQQRALYTKLLRKRRSLF